jgi:hypothetical protein
MFVSRLRSVKSPVYKDDRSDALFYKKLHVIADRAAPKIRQQILTAIARLKSDLQLWKLEKAIQTGSVAEILRVLNITSESAYLTMTAQEMRNIFNEAGVLSTAALPAAVGAKIAELGFRFDLNNPASLEFLKTYSFGLIKSINDNTLEGIRTTIRTAFEKGGHPFEQAKKIRDLIGLLPRQVQAVSAYETQLIEDGRAAAQVARMTEAYAGRLLKQRTETIARTETIRAASAGQRALWQQAIDADLLPAGVKVTWIAADDDLLCPECESLNGESQALGDTWTSVGGLTAEHPPLHPRCRCGEALDL